MAEHIPVSRGLMLLFACLLGCGSETEVDLVIGGVSVVDIEDGSVRPDQVIQIDAGRIVDIRPSADGPMPASATFVDGRRLYVIPGLWDMHVHALWDSAVALSFLPAFARAGITGIRDMGGDLNVLERVRSAAESESWNWPRIIAVGQVLDGPIPIDPSMSLAVGTTDEAKQAVDQLAAHGVDFIKVYTLLPRDAYFAVLERAQALGLPVVGHIPAEVSVLEAIEAGQIGIEHLRDELEPFCHDMDYSVCEALIQRFRELSIQNTPTLVVLEAKADFDYRSSEVSSAAPNIPDLVEAYWRSSAIAQHARPKEWFARRSALFAEESAMVGRLHRGGASILAGSDAGNPFIFPGLSLHRELELLVEAGLTAQEALLSATLGPARFLGIADSVGEVRPGFTADLVLLGGNPLDDILNVRRVSEVVVRGRALGLNKLGPAGEVRQP